MARLNRAMTFLAMWCTFRKTRGLEGRAISNDRWSLGPRRFREVRHDEVPKLLVVRGRSDRQRIGHRRSRGGRDVHPIPGRIFRLYPCAGYSRTSTAGAPADRREISATGKELPARSRLGLPQVRVLQTHRHVQRSRDQRLSDGVRLTSPAAQLLALCNPSVRLSADAMGQQGMRR